MEREQKPESPAPAVFAVREDLHEAAQLLRRARALLDRARDKADESPDGSRLGWGADLARERLLVVESDLNDVLDGEAATQRVAPVATGLPPTEDAGGGFGARALQALALCREAWAGADEHNAPRMEKAMGWIVRAWLATCGPSRGRVVRAVLTHGLDAGGRTEQLVAHVTELAVGSEPTRG
jgi:hypothetical protein